MKKLILGAITAMTVSTFAQPVAPYDYEPSEHSKSELQEIYNALIKDEMKGEDCFKRAYLWSYQMVHTFKAKPIKVFFHYTDKFNAELDAQGKETKLGRLFGGGSKIMWDFHVAPALEDDKGNVYVLDPIVFPRAGGPQTLQEWVDGLKKRGDYFLNKRKGKVLDELDYHEGKLASYQAKRQKLISKERSLDNINSKITTVKAEIKKQEDLLKYLGVSKNRSVKDTISCSPITHIEEFDKHQKDAYCFYQKSSMYYYATGELRILNYGTLDYKSDGNRSNQYDINRIIGNIYRWPVNETNLATKEYFAYGKDMYNQEFYDDGANYTRDSFTDYYLEKALSEIEYKNRPDLALFKSQAIAITDEYLEQVKLEEERIKEEERRIREENARREKEQARLERQRRREERRARRNQ